MIQTTSTARRLIYVCEAAGANDSRHHPPLSAAICGGQSLLARVLKEISDTTATVEGCGKIPFVHFGPQDVSLELYSGVIGSVWLH